MLGQGAAFDVKELGKVNRLFVAAGPSLVGVMKEWFTRMVAARFCAGCEGLFVENTCAFQLEFHLLTVIICRRIEELATASVVALLHGVKLCFVN